MTNKTWTNEELHQAVQKAQSIAGVLRELNLKAAGGNYASIHKHISSLNLNTSHFKGQGHNKGKQFGPKRPLTDYFSNEYPIQSHRLKQRMIREGLFEHKCYNCLLDKWLDKPVPLELEHIDGNHMNNALENLTLLCPNCHALTETYRGKNVGRTAR